jgi:glycosyltransferase involved in cell wall biosynthesis
MGANNGGTIMRVLFYVGYPLAWAKGGHTLQILESKRAVEQLGCEVQWLHHEDIDIPRADVIHYWSRPPHDFHWQLARQQGLKIVISEYHQAAVLRPRWTWPWRRWMAQGLQRALGRNLFSFFGADIYKECDAAIAITTAEAEYMQVVFEANSSKIHCIPNGVDDVFFDNTLSPEPINSLVYIGYICERKNSVSVAKAALSAGVPITFVGGAPFGTSDPYVTEFMSLVDNARVSWLGDVADRHRLASIIRGSRGVLLASKNEGLPLSILEALACKKPVCCSNLPNLRSYFGNAITYCHQPQSSEFINELQRFSETCETGTTISFPVPSWREVGQSIVNVYIKATGSPNQGNA